jgi:AcrR family transcriptional regulator
MSRNNSRAQILDAAVALITRRGDAKVTMAEIGKEAGVSRQAVYLNFADRADLMLALVRHVDEIRGLEKELQKLADAPTGLAALREMVSLQARLNPDVWAIARALDAVRRTDAEVEKSWQDRLNSRLRGSRAIILRLAADGNLRKGLKPTIAADILWSVTSLRTWEDLVLQRGWSAAQYENRIYNLLLATLTEEA